MVLPLNLLSSVHQVRSEQARITTDSRTIVCWKYNKLAPNSDVCSLLPLLSIILSLTHAIFHPFLMSHIRHLSRRGAPLYYSPFLTYTRTLLFSNLRRLHSIARR